MSFRRNVYVLGAGFSADAGAPVMSNFFSRARDLKDNPSSGLAQSEREIFGRVVQYRFDLDKALAKVLVDLDNIEQLFGFLEMELRLSSRVSADLTKNMKYLIARTLELTSTRVLSTGLTTLVTRPVGGNRFQYRFNGNQYGFFAGFASGRWNPSKQSDGKSSDSIISFNYDLILEREMGALGILPVYESTGAAYYEGFPQQKVQLTLLKMHGSANWLHCPRPSCDDVLWAFTPEKAKAFEVEGRRCPSCRQPGLVTVIVPPTWNKGLEAKFILPVWKRVLEELTTAGRIFIIGYSFPESDQFFKYLLGLALSTNTALTEIHVVSDSMKIRDRFEGLFHPYFHGRVVKYHPDGTANFLQRIQDYTNQEFDEEALRAHFNRA
jgi:hypothetical protein